MAEALDEFAPRTLADDAYVELKSLILGSVLAPGEKLSIDGMARRLVVSQTPVREALARLEAEGLVERRPLSGYTVTPMLTETEFEDLFELRLMMEPLAAGRAAERGDDRDRPAASLRALALAPEPSDDGERGRFAFTAADVSFHEQVARGSGSGVLATAIRRLDAHLHLHRAVIAPSQIRQTMAEHLAIADAIIEMKPLAAAEAMRRHLERARARHAPAFRFGAAPATNQMR